MRELNVEDLDLFSVFNPNSKNIRPTGNCYHVIDCVEFEKDFIVEPMWDLLEFIWKNILDMDEMTFCGCEKINGKYPVTMENVSVWEDFLATRAYDTYEKNVIGTLVYRDYRVYPSKNISVEMLVKAIVCRLIENLEATIASVKFENY